MTLSKKSSGNPEIGEPKGWKLCGPVGGISTLWLISGWLFQCYFLVSRGCFKVKTSTCFMENNLMRMRVDLYHSLMSACSLISLRLFSCSVDE